MIDEFVIAEILMELIREKYDTDRMTIHTESCGYTDADNRSYQFIGKHAQDTIDMIERRTGITLDNSWISYKDDVVEDD